MEQFSNSIYTNDFIDALKPGLATYLGSRMPFSQGWQNFATIAAYLDGLKFRFNVRTHSDPTGIRGHIDPARYTNSGYYTVNQIINHITITRNINACFEEAARVCASTSCIELNNVSLGLIEDRYHRIKVYKPRDNVIIILSNKPLNTYPLTLQKIYASLPYCLDLDEEKYPVALYKACATHSYDSWLTMCKAWVETTILASIEDETLKQVFTQMATLQRTNVQHNYDNVAQSIVNAEAELRSRYTRRRELSLQLHALVEEPALDVQEALRIIKNTNSFSQFTLDRNTLRFTVTTTLCNYDLDAATRIINSKINHNPNNKRYCALAKIFLENNASVLVKQDIKINLTEAYVEDTHNTHTNAIMNPHFEYYHCWGSYSSPISKALTSGLYIEALMLILNACGSINFLDSPVMNHFFEAVNSNFFEVQCINMQNKIYTLNEYIELGEQNNEATTTD